MGKVGIIIYFSGINLEIYKNLRMHLYEGQAVLSLIKGCKGLGEVIWSFLVMLGSALKLCREASGPY